MDASTKPGSARFWPETTHYNAAVQNPQECFTDPELRLGAVEGDFFGLPRPYAGAFASVYRVECPGGQCWAVKCFTRKVDDLQQRYAAISAHLQKENRPFNVEFRYLPEGIRVEGRAFPVLKMRWVQGFTLNEFLAEHAGNAGALAQLARLWVKLAHELREARMGHGDLQHGNVLLVPGSKEGALGLRLIDYDGMWVEALLGNPPGERGHPNYQHPQRLREGGWYSEIDRFSHLTIYTALRALQVGGKALWERYDNSENMLFRAADFEAPNQSALLRELWALPEPQVRLLVGHLVLASQAPLDEVPFLGDLVDRTEVHPLSAEQRERVRALLAPAAGGGRHPASRERDEASRERKRPELAPQTPVAHAPGSPAPPSAPAAVPDWLSSALPAEAQPAEILDALPADSTTPSVSPTVGETALGTATLPEVVPAPEPGPARRPLRERGNRTRGEAPALGTRERPAPVPRPAPAPGFSALLRYWPAALAALVLLPLAALLLWLVVHWGKKPHPQPVVKPKLTSLPHTVSLKPGKQQALTVEIDRGTFSDELRLRVEELPDGVKWEATPLGEGAEASLTLTASADAGPGSKPVKVSLWGRERLDEKTLDLTVVPFVRPRLGTVGAVTLLAGTTKVVEVRVDRQGNTDPLTALVDPLPEGVKQASIPARAEPGAPAEAVRIELTAEAEAPENVKTGRLKLFADGVLAGEQLLSVAVEHPKEAGVALRVPEVVAVGSAKTPVRVELARMNFTGPVVLSVEDLPATVFAGSVTVPPEEESAEMEIQALAWNPAAANPLGPAGKEWKAKVVALVDGKPAGEKGFTLALKAAGEPPAAVKPPVKERGPMPRPQTVRFSSADHVTLVGTLYPSPDGVKGRCALLLHDFESSRSEANWVRLAESLQKAGYAVLTFDFRGHGESVAVPRGKLFWGVPANKLLLPAGRVNPTALDARTFPASYYPNLVQDVVAARLLLDLKHDAGEVNTSNLVVIGAGEAAGLGALWLASECKRHKVGQGPGAGSEVKDVVAAVWIGSTVNLTGNARVVNWLRETERVAEFPMAFVYGGNSLPSAGPSRALAAGARAVAVKEKVEEKVVAGSARSGQMLLRKEEAEKAVLGFLEGAVGELRPHAVRNVRTTGYVWTLPGTPPNVSAKAAGSVSPLLLPVERVR